MSTIAINNGRVADENMSLLIDAALALGNNTDVDRDCLAYLCLSCQSIGMASDNESRENLVAGFDLTCCTPESLVVFHND